MVLFPYRLGIHPKTLVACAHCVSSEAVIPNPGFSLALWTKSSQLVWKLFHASVFTVRIVCSLVKWKGAVLSFDLCFWMEAGSVDRLHGVAVLWMTLHVVSKIFRAKLAPACGWLRIELVALSWAIWVVSAICLPGTTLGNSDLNWSS